MSSGYHTSWKVPPEHREDPEYRAAGGGWTSPRRSTTGPSALGWRTAELADRADMSEEDIESIEESGVDPTLELIEQLTAALESGARIDPRTTPEFRFEGHAA
ncbi:hypothetical protein [Streptomyces sp. NPDC093544]|uniref:hypothetical protein n=1 Tax=Streptomyces sp. NPDC093544 TaxID=3155200 RepID=UPI00342B6134